VPYLRYALFGIVFIALSQRHRPSRRGTSVGLSKRTVMFGPWVDELVDLSILFFFFF